MDDCEHIWHCPNAVALPQDGGVAIYLALYCQRCCEVRTKLAPPPEVAPSSKITRAQLVPQPR